MFFVFRWLPLAMLAASPTSFASDVASTAQWAGGFTGLSFVGDGTTPPAMTLFDSMSREFAQPRFGAAVGDRGDASHSIGVPLAPARLMPEIGFSYSSTGNEFSYLGRGWDIHFGMRIDRVIGAAKPGAYAPYEQVYRVSGGGVDGIIFEELGEWVYVSTNGVAARFESLPDYGWRVEVGGVTTELAPHHDTFAAIDSKQAPNHWHPTRSRDALGNAVTWNWDGMRLLSIDYGGQVEPSWLVVEPHFIQVKLGYADRFGIGDGPQARGEAGLLDVIEHRLTSVLVSSTRSGVDDRAQLDFVYDAAETSQQLTEVLQVAADGSTLSMGTFRYATYDFATPLAGVPTLLDGEADGLQTPFAPESIGFTTPRRDGQPSASWSREVPRDLTGDGLVDLSGHSEGYAFVWSDELPSWLTLALPGSRSISALFLTSSPGWSRPGKRTWAMSTSRAISRLAEMAARSRC